jgi:hypothetical protein
VHAQVIAAFKQMSTMSLTHRNLEDISILWSFSISQYVDF